MLIATPVSSVELMDVLVYLRTSFHPDRHFVDGETEERAVGEWTHGKLQYFVMRWFSDHNELWQTDANIEQRIRVSSSRVRVCDVVLIRGALPHEEVITVPPLVCVEILSPEDRLSRAALVLEDCRRMGVQHCWLLDPIHRAAYTYDEAGLHVTLEGQLEIAGTDIHLPFNALFARFDPA